MIIVDITYAIVQYHLKYHLASMDNIENELKELFNIEFDELDSFAKASEGSCEETNPCSSKNTLPISPPTYSKILNLYTEEEFGDKNRKSTPEDTIIIKLTERQNITAMNL